MRNPRIWAAAVLALTVLALTLAYGDELAVKQLAGRLSAVRGWVEANQLLAPVLFILVYVAVTGLSLPGAAALSLIAGSLFGLWLGVVLVAVGSTAGATVAMLVARHLLRDFVERRFPEPVARVNRGIARDGAGYLFALRLIPAVPFFLLNLASGLSRMRIVTFAWVTLIGALPATIVYVNAGQQLATIEEASDVLSPRVILSFLALAALPFAAKLARRWWQRRRHSGGRRDAPPD